MVCVAELLYVLVVDDDDDDARDHIITVLYRIPVDCIFFVLLHVCCCFSMRIAVYIGVARNRLRSRCYKISLAAKVSDKQRNGKRGRE